MAISYRRVLVSAGYSDTWLSPYVGFVFKIIDKNGKKYIRWGKNIELITGYLKYFGKPLNKANETLWTE